MNELIYKQDAIDAVDERIQTLLKDEAFRQKCGDRDLYGVKKLLQNLPSADVVTVVHGKWIVGKEIAREWFGDHTLHIDYEDYKCSVCGLTLDRLLYCVDGSLFYKYCPRCGAKMDGGK